MDDKIIKFAAAAIDKINSSGLNENEKDNLKRIVNHSALESIKIASDDREGDSVLREYLNSSIYLN